MLHLTQHVSPPTSRLTVRTLSRVDHHDPLIELTYFQSLPSITMKHEFLTAILSSSHLPGRETIAPSHLSPHTPNIGSQKNFRALRKKSNKIFLSFSSSFFATRLVSLHVFLIPIFHVCFQFHCCTGRRVTAQHKQLPVNQVAYFGAGKKGRIGTDEIDTSDTASRGSRHGMEMET